MVIVKKEKLERLIKSSKILNYTSYELFIIVGVLMAIGTLGKLLGYYDMSSDWFWFLAGIGLILEGTISLIKQRRFDNKYKIVERETIIPNN